MPTIAFDEQGKIKLLYGELGSSGGGGGGSVDYNRVIEKSVSLPSLETVSVGKVYMYTGVNTVNYTHGYIYEVVATETSTAVSFSSNNITWDVDDFVEYLKEGGNSWNEVVNGTLYYLGSDSDLWRLTGYNSNGIQVLQFQEYTADLEQFGCTFTVPPQDGDNSTFELTTTQDGKAWRRVDVQPSTGGTTVASITEGQTITLSSDTIYTGGEISVFSIVFPSNPTAAFIAETDFTSGTTPTTLTYPTGIKWTGDDLTSNEFVPVASKRYNVIWWYDGVNWNANASARI